MRALLISEYVEGSSSNKALELRALASSSLDGCRVAIYSNGATEASGGNVVKLEGALNAGQSYVVCSKSLAAQLGATCDREFTVVFSGNDAVSLECDDALIDVIGQIGFDPKTAWGAGDVSTVNQTLRRRCSVTQGDADGSDVFDPSVEWQAFATDDFSGLGASGCD